MPNPKSIDPSPAKSVKHPSPPPPIVALAPLELFKRMLFTSLLIFAVGYGLTTLWVEAASYPQLPFKGEVQLRDTGEAYFNAYYPKFRRYAIVNNPAEAGTESYFSRAGVLGTGVFFYATVNAPHWIFELTVYNLRGMVLIPFLVILAGCYFFLFRGLPLGMQTEDNAISYCSLIGILHAVWVALMLLVGQGLSVSVSTLFMRPNYYGGQFLGTLLPGIVIIIITGLFYGAIVGGLLSAQVKFLRFLSHSSHGNLPSKKIHA